MNKPIPGFSKYFINEHGQVLSQRFNIVTGKYKLPLTPQTKTNGYIEYLMVDDHGERKHKLAHRLVAEAFLPNPDNLPEVDHKDKDLSNNHKDNLEWVSVAENRKRAAQDGAWRRNVSLEDEQLIVEAYKSGSNQEAIAKDFGIAQPTVSDYLRKNGIRVKRITLSDRDLESLRAEYLNGTTPATLKEKYGVALQTIYKLVKNERRFSEEYQEILDRL